MRKQIILFYIFHDFGKSENGQIHLAKKRCKLSVELYYVHAEVKLH